jgi:cobalamin synthase
MSASGHVRRSARFLNAIRSPEGAKFAPLAGALIGALGGAVYWLSAKLWPSNVAMILSMAVTALLAGGIPSIRLFYLLIKYNALMALSAAQLPFAAPANLALGLIMICGQAASFALVVAIMATRPEKSAAKVSGTDFGIALLLGFAPAALLGVPGLIGLVAAIVMGLGFIAYLRFRRAGASSQTLDMTQLFTELSFYLGALASWRYV